MNTPSRQVRRRIELLERKRAIARLRADALAERKAARDARRAGRANTTRRIAA